MNKLRPLGQITDDLEPLFDEMVTDHELQIHEIIGIINQYLQAHHPSAIEQYEDGTIPVLYYGHIEGIKK